MSVAIRLTEKTDQIPKEIALTTYRFIGKDKKGWCEKSFWCGVALVLAAEHWLARPKRGQPLDLIRINVAFFYLNVVISLGLLGIGLADMFL